MGLSQKREYEKYLIEKGVCTEKEIEQGREEAKTMDWDKMFQSYHPKLQDFVIEAMLIFAEGI